MWAALLSPIGGLSQRWNISPQYFASSLVSCLLLISMLK